MTVPKPYSFGDTFIFEKNHSLYLRHFICGAFFKVVFFLGIFILKYKVKVPCTKTKDGEKTL